MKFRSSGAAVCAQIFSALVFLTWCNGVQAQQQTTSSPATATAENATSSELTDDEMQVLVARIALYPDELVALITSASLFPLQIVEASRFLDQVKGNTALKPKTDWDGSVVSLLNYPDVVKMMSDDLDWTQQLGDVVANQQKDMLIAIQTLRDKAVAQDIIKSDDKLKVVQQNDNVVIAAANPEKIYVPRYEPQMLYEDGYRAVPITYYPEPYPNYYYPTATYFAGMVTGAVFGAMVDWDSWDVWGGRYDGRDIDIDCDHCFNGIDRNGKINFNDVDWKNVDRSKLKFDHQQFAKIDKNNIRNRLEAGGNNNIRNKAKAVRAQASTFDRSKVTTSAIKDVRANKIANRALGNRPELRNRTQGTAGSEIHNRLANRPESRGHGNIQRPDLNRAISHHPMAGKRDIRPHHPSGLGEIRSRGAANLHSQRGARAMGGGHHGRAIAAHRGGGGRHISGGGRAGGHARMPHGGRRH